MDPIDEYGPEYGHEYYEEDNEEEIIKQFE